jgi:sigma-B regulation protein RsbU (phosphoserine phosphatase)
VLELDSKGFFIGSFEDSIYQEKWINFAPGDRFYFYTDGITEVRNARGQQFGRENLKKVICDNNRLELEAISNMIVSMLMMYMHEPIFSDDLTLVILEIMESL